MQKPVLWFNAETCFMIHEQICKELRTVFSKCWRVAHVLVKMKQCFFRPFLGGWGGACFWVYSLIQANLIEQKHFLNEFFISVSGQENYSTSHGIRGRLEGWKMPSRPVVPKVDFWALPVKTEGAQALGPPRRAWCTHTHQQQSRKVTHFLLNKQYVLPDLCIPPHALRTWKC